jgi:hypothetical protein
MSKHDEVAKAYREFISKMYGVAPNRFMLTHEDALAFIDELRPQLRHMDIPEDPDFNCTGGNYTKVIYMGMRLVVDPHAVGVECGYVR